MDMTITVVVVSYTMPLKGANKKSSFRELARSKIIYGGYYHLSTSSPASATEPAPLLEATVLTGV